VSTLQTSRPLRRVSMSTSNRPVDVLLWWTSKDHGLDVDPPYQRGHVWGATRQRNLIRSLLLGVPIPSIIINDRYAAEFRHEGWSEERCWSHAIIDGKQRITAFLHFLNGNLGVPASWFEPADVIESSSPAGGDGPWVFFPGLSVPMQRHIRNMTIGVAEGRFKTLDEEREVFDLVNFGGVPQGETDAEVES
jgi:uncharacterized protein DUF262